MSLRGGGADKAISDNGTKGFGRLLRFARNDILGTAHFPMTIQGHQAASGDCKAPEWSALRNQVQQSFSRPVYCFVSA